MKKLTNTSGTSKVAKTRRPQITQAEKIQKAYESKGSTLDIREREIIEKYYGMNGNLRHTLEEIAKAYGVSRERIRQVKHYAIKKILPDPVKK